MPSSPVPHADTYGNRSTRTTSVGDVTYLNSTDSTATDSAGVSVTGESYSRKGIRIIEARRNVYVHFKVTPEISESATANYIEESDIRAASSLLIYMGSPARNFSFNAKLVSRTEKEALENFKYLNLLKSWRMPFVGEQALDSGGNQLETGTNSPQVLYIRSGGMFRDVQVVMRSLNIEYNTDSDRISVEGDKDTKMPIILPISMTFQEIHSATEIKEFDIISYKDGSLSYW